MTTSTPPFTMGWTTSRYGLVRGLRSARLCEAHGGAAHGVLALEAQRHGAEVGLVEERLAVELQRDGIPERARDLDRGLGVVSTAVSSRPAGMPAARSISHTSVRRQPAARACRSCGRREHRRARGVGRPASSLAAAVGAEGVADDVARSSSWSMSRKILDLARVVVAEPANTHEMAASHAPPLRDTSRRGTSPPGPGSWPPGPPRAP